MKKPLAILTIVAALALHNLSASVTINFGLGTMYSSTNTSTLFPDGGLVNLLALDSGSWSSLPALLGYSSLNEVFANTTSSFLPVGVTLVGQIALTPGSAGIVGGDYIFSYGGSFSAGDELMTVAYPNLTLASLSPGVNQPGFFFRSATAVDGSLIGWVAPADGFTGAMGAYTIDQSGSVANDQFTSGAGAAGGNGFTTVPEPSTYALLALSGLALGGYAMRRRRRA